MDFTLTADQQDVRTVFAEFFAKESPLSAVRESEPLGWSPLLWDALSSTGAVMMAVPEEAGGGGATTLELGLVAEEYGRRLAPVPFVEAVVACDVLASTEAGRDLLTEVATGALVPTVALRPPVDGRARLVPAGAVADLLVVLDGEELVALRRSGDRPYTTSPRNLGSSPIADWAITDRSLQRVTLARGQEARQLFSTALSLWRTLGASALNGLRAEALDMAVGYVKTRKAFGAPIGSFMAIQHRLADVAAAGDGVELLTREAAWARDHAADRHAALAGMAFLAASRLAFKTCREALQFHGGYGYTLEYDIQLFFRRAKAWPLAIGARTDQYRRLADVLFPSSEG
jgi:alkylation response protein AidB-like acyl-CoA dehydrogenase